MLAVNEKDIYRSLKKILPKHPSLVVMHSSLINFNFEGGKPKWPFIKAIKTLADEGYTIALPSFTFSFTNTGEFNSITTNSETGILADWVFQLNNSIRTKHPIYSHVVIGPLSDKCLSASVRTCFGKDSIFSIFEKHNASIVMYGCGWKYCTSFHYFEEINNVPYRYNKKFFFKDAKKEFTEMYVRDLGKHPKNDFIPAIDILREKSLIKTQYFHEGVIESISFKDLALISNNLLKKDKYTFLKNSMDVKKLINEEEQAKHLSINVGIFGDSNLDLLRKKFEESSRDIIRGCNINHFSSEYGQMYSDLVVKKLKKFKLDFSFLPNRLEDIYQVSNIDLIDFSNTEPLDRYLDFIIEISQITSRKVFVNEFFINTEQVNGPIYLENLEGTFNFLRNANSLLRDQVDKYPNVYIVSPQAMLSDSIESDPRLWYLGRIPFSDIVSEKIAYSYCSFIADDLGKTARLIILDLDNTLWGGVLGEDGIKGIKIGGDFPGNAYRDFQKTILKLKSRGIALAVVSKNDEDLALKALNTHSENLIKESDLAAYRINWKEKYINIIEICNDLSLGLSNVIFVDDNPIEREKVKMNLPEVNVLELTKDPSFYRKSLLNNYALGLSNFSSEDIKRADNYIKRKEINKTRHSFKDINQFFKSLKIKVYIQNLNDGNFARALQLISKTNQFNTTTRRYNDKEIAQINESDNRLIKVIGYEDKITESENIGLFILKKENKEIHIESFLLSCRVLDRGIEKAALNWIDNYSLDNGIKKIVGEIIKTPRNTPVQNLYQANKFSFDNKGLKWVKNSNHGIDIPPYIDLIEGR